MNRILLALWLAVAPVCLLSASDAALAQDAAAAQGAAAPAPAADEKDVAADVAALSAAVPDDKGFVTRFLEKNLSGASRQVVLEGFQGALSSRATFTRLTIADDQGVWITLRDGAIQWDRAALFSRRIEISELSAAEIDLPRLPASGPSGPRPEVRAFQLPALPVSVNIARIAAGRVILGQPVLGEAAEVSIDGSMNLAGGEGAARLAIQRVDGKRGVFALDTSYSNQTTVLKLGLNLDEDKGGLFANAVKLYDRPAVKAEITGNGPIRDFAADIRLATDGQDRVTGRAAAHAEPDSGGEPGTAFRLELAGDVGSLLPPDNRSFFGASSQLVAQGWRADTGRLSIPELSLGTEALKLTGAIYTTAEGAPQSVVMQMNLGRDAGAPVLPVRLPVGGTPVTVDSGSLQISYDQLHGEGWTLSGRLGDLQRQGNRIGGLTLDGSGRIVLNAGSLAQMLGQMRIGVTGLAPADPGLAQALGDRLDAAARFDLTPGNAMQLTGVTIDGADYGLSGDLRADGLKSGITLSGALDARYQNLARLSTLAGRPLTGRAEGTISGLYTLLTRGFDAEVKLRGTDITVNQPQADRLLAGGSVIELSARRDESGITLRNLTVDAQRLNATAEGTVTSAATDIKARLRMASLTDADPSIAGSLTADAAVTGPPGQRRITLSGQALELAVGVPELDAALKGRTDLTAVLQEANGGLSIDTLRLTNPQLTAAGTGNLIPGAMDAKLDLDVPDLAVLGHGLSGAVKAQATARDQDGARIVEMTGTGQELRLGQKDVDGALTGTTDFTLSAEQKGGVTTLRSLKLTNQQMNATAEGVFGPGVTDLTANADIRSLAAFGRGWRGAVRLDGSLSDDGSGKRVLDVTGTGRDLSLGQAQVDGVLGGPTDLRIRAVQEGQRLTIEEARLTNAQGAVTAQGRYAPGDTDLSGHAEIGNLSALGLGWRGAVTADGSFRDDGTGARRLDVTGTARDLSLGQAQADAALAGETRFALRGTERDGTLRLDEAAVDNPRLHATAEGALGRGTTDLRARLRADSLAFLGHGFGGAVDAGATVQDQPGGRRRLTAEGTANNLRIGNAKADALLGGQTRFDLAAMQGDGKVTLERVEARNDRLRLSASGDPAQGMTVDAGLSDLALLVPGLPGPASAKGTIRQGPKDYAIDIAATAPGGTRAQIAGTAARDFSTADIRVNGVSDAALVNPMLRVRSVEGPVDFDLRLNGRPSLQNLTGRVRLPNARLSDPKFGLRIDGLDATADLNGGLIRIDAAGNVAGGGRVTIRGPVDLRGGSPTLDLRLGLDDVVLRDPNLYQTTASGTLSVGGALADGPLISGTINLGPTEFRIPSTGLGGAKDIPRIRHVRDSAPVRATRAKAGLLPFPSADSRIAGMIAPPATPPAVQARLDLTVNAPNQVYVRGRGVDAELGGQIRLTGRANAVVPVGQLQLIRGRVDLLGKRFDLDEGLIELQGSFVPVIRLVAANRQSDITTRIIIDGELRDPDITFESDPDLPQEEVLSHLLFGRGLDSISALQAAQLANAVAVLAGKGGAGIVANLRNATGLDDLDLATDADGNVTVRAGKYLSRNLYTDVSVDDQGKSKINLNLDVNDQLTARGSVASDGESTIGLFYEKDY